MVTFAAVLINDLTMTKRSGRLLPSWTLSSIISECNAYIELASTICRQEEEEQARALHPLLNASQLFAEHVNELAHVALNSLQEEQEEE